MKYCISIRQNFSICLCLFAFSVLIVNGLPVETWAPKKVNFQEKEGQSGQTELVPSLLGCGFEKMALFACYLM